MSGFLHFSPKVTGKRVEIADGSYHRIFERTAEPFAVDSTEEEALLLATGLFESTEHVTAPVGPDEDKNQPKDGE